jgi:hypothetical protein
MSSLGFLFCLALSAGVFTAGLRRLWPKVGAGRRMLVQKSLAYAGGWLLVAVADTEAVLFVRIPQIPSSRRFGTYPAGFLTELAGRAPWRRSERETAQDSGARRFPQRLQGSCR